jgi:hypothetical protein
MADNVKRQPADGEDSDDRVVKFPDQSGPDDTADITRLFDPEIGDSITDTVVHGIPLGKPRDFFRTHPEKAYRQSSMVYCHKPENVIDAQYFIIDPAMQSHFEDDARKCTLVTVIDRTGDLRLWPISMPRESEHDNEAWKSARAAARRGIDKWVRVVWSKRAYKVREAKVGYAPEPDWSKLPPFHELVRIAFGEHGIVRDENHPIYCALLGTKAAADDDDI